MKKWTRKRLSVKEALEVLGKDWTTETCDGRNTALYNVSGFKTRGCICEDLYHFNKEDDTIICGEAKIEVENRPFWPKWSCSLDLTNFFADEQGNIPHPLAGFYIPELIAATNYPFYNPERVRAILVHTYSDTKNAFFVNHRAPNAVIFVETWSHYDDKVQLGTCDASVVFNPYGAEGLLDSVQLKQGAAHLGKNFIVMPFGYDCKKGMSTTEGEKLWRRIIQDFLDGKENSAEPAEKSTEADAFSIDDVLSTVDNTAAAVCAEETPGEDKGEHDETFADYQKELAEIYQEKFLTEENINKALMGEALLRPAKDGNGVLLYRADYNFEDTLNALTSTVIINGVIYMVKRYNYCRKHLQKLEADLDTLVSEVLAD